MDLKFSIVLFENEGYATVRGDKGVQDILASKADAGYIKDGTYPIIFSLHPYCWKWWISPKQEKINFSMFSADSWLDRPLQKNKPIQQRLIHDCHIVPHLIDIVLRDFPVIPLLFGVIITGFALQYGKGVIRHTHKKIYVCQHKWV